MKLFLILLSVVLIFAACNLFEPREADSPDKPVLWNAFPTTPGKCLENLVLAYQHREYVYQYGTIFTNEFEFWFDKHDVTDFSLPIFWIKQDETEMLINAYQQTGLNQEINLTLSPIPNQPDSNQANRAWVNRYYHLTVNHNQQNLNTEFSGIAQIQLERGSDGFWRISRWDDLRDQGFWTWGRMKNAFSTT